MIEESAAVPQGNNWLRTLRRCTGNMRYSLGSDCPSGTAFDGVLGYVR